MIVPSTQKVQSSDRVQHVIFQIPYKPGFMETDILRFELEGNKFKFLLKMSEILTTVCESALNNTEVMETLKGFDLLLYDMLGVCGGALLGERLGIPRVQIVPVPSILDHMIPTPLSYAPMLFTDFTDKMTFMQRVINLGAYLAIGLVRNILFNRPMDALKLKYNITPERSYQEAVDGVELVLIRSDFALEYAKPLLPGN